MAPCTLQSTSAFVQPLAPSSPSARSLSSLATLHLDGLRGSKTRRHVLRSHRVSAANSLPGQSPSNPSVKKQSRNSGIIARAASTITPETPAPSSASSLDGEVYSYQAEVSRLMDIIVHSLYSHREVFLRELVSNGSDALDKLRFLSVTDPSLMGSESDLAIRIRPVPDEKILIIEDSGIGMTKEELISSLGTIAQSGTANFLKALKDNKAGPAGDNNLIGRFGVGFYSAFLVADKVAVSTRRAGSDKQFVWESEANSSAFVIREETNPEYLLPRGTAVILHLKEDCSDFSDITKIQDLVKNYSQFLSFPIYIGREKTKPAAQEGEEIKQEKRQFSYELVNETKPIWLRSPKEVTKEEYLAYYKKTYSEHVEPMAYTHFNTEGEVEFKSLLYVPGMAPFGKDADAADNNKNLRLYVKRVFISDQFDGDLFPRYLCFMKGVVDSNDLPLNVSRELLQESRVMRLMRKRLVKKTFDLFDSIMKRENPEDYKKFWTNFGKYIKLGITSDKDNHKRLCTFLRYFSSKHQEDMTSLKEYVANMKEGQNAIYYFSSESVKSARNAPFLEKLYEKDYEVLFLVEAMDEVSIQALKSYQGKDFVDVSKEDFDLGDDDEEVDNLANEYGYLCDWMKAKLGERIAKVEVSRRLSSSPCALISGKHGWSANMERIMRAQNLGNTPGLREYMASTRILEINPKHPIIQFLEDARESGRPGIEDTIDLLYETALMSSGFVPEDPSGFGSRIYDLMTSSVKGDSEFVQQAAYEEQPSEVVQQAAYEEQPSEVVQQAAYEEQPSVEYYNNPGVQPQYQSPTPPPYGQPYEQQGAGYYNPGVQPQYSASPSPHGQPYEQPSAGNYSPGTQPQYPPPGVEYYNHGTQPPYPPQASPYGQPTYEQSTGGNYSQGGQPHYAPPSTPYGQPPYEQSAGNYNTGGQPSYNTGGQTQYAPPFSPYGQPSREQPAGNYNSGGQPQYPPPSAAYGQPSREYYNPGTQPQNAPPTQSPPQNAPPTQPPPPVVEPEVM